MNPGAVLGHIVTVAKIVYVQLQTHRENKKEAQALMQTLDMLEGTLAGLPRGGGAAFDRPLKIILDMMRNLEQELVDESMRHASLRAILQAKGLKEKLINWKRELETHISHLTLGLTAHTASKSFDKSALADIMTGVGAYTFWTRYFGPETREVEWDQLRAAFVDEMKHMVTMPQLALVKSRLDADCNNMVSAIEFAQFTTVLGYPTTFTQLFSLAEEIEFEHDGSAPVGDLIDVLAEQIKSTDGIDTAALEQDGEFEKVATPILPPEAVARARQLFHDNWIFTVDDLRRLQVREWARLNIPVRLARELQMLCWEFRAGNEVPRDAADIAFLVLLGSRDFEYRSFDDKLRWMTAVSNFKEEWEKYSFVISALDLKVFENLVAVITSEPVTTETQGSTSEPTKKQHRITKKLRRAEAAAAASTAAAIAAEDVPRRAALKSFWEIHQRHIAEAGRKPMRPYETNYLRLVDAAINALVALTSLDGFQFPEFVAGTYDVPQNANMFELKQLNADNSLVVKLLQWIERQVLTVTSYLAPEKMANAYYDIDREVALRSLLPALGLWRRLCVIEDIWVVHYRVLLFWISEWRQSVLPCTTAIVDFIGPALQAACALVTTWFGPNGAYTRADEGRTELSWANIRLVRDMFRDVKFDTTADLNVSRAPGFNPAITDAAKPSTAPVAGGELDAVTELLRKQREKERRAEQLEKDMQRLVKSEHSTFVQSLEAVCVKMIDTDAIKSDPNAAFHLLAVLSLLTPLFHRHYLEENLVTKIVKIITLHKNESPLGAAVLCLSLIGYMTLEDQGIAVLAGTLPKDGPMKVLLTQLEKAPFADAVLRITALVCDQAFLEFTMQFVAMVLVAESDNARCNFVDSRVHFVPQAFYHCSCAEEGDGTVACVTCARDCHAKQGHSVAFESVGIAFCDCGYNGMKIACQCPPQDGAPPTRTTYPAITSALISQGTNLIRNLMRLSMDANRGLVDVTLFINEFLFRRSEDWYHAAIDNDQPTFFARRFFTWDYVDRLMNNTNDSIEFFAYQYLAQIVAPTAPPTDRLASIITRVRQRVARDEIAIRALVAGALVPKQNSVKALDLREQATSALLALLPIETAYHTVVTTTPRLLCAVCSVKLACLENVCYTCFRTSPSISENCACGNPFILDGNASILACGFCEVAFFCSTSCTASVAHQATCRARVEAHQNNNCACGKPLGVGESSSSFKTLASSASIPVPSATSGAALPHVPSTPEQTVVRTSIKAEKKKKEKSPEGASGSSSSSSSDSEEEGSKAVVPDNTRHVDAGEIQLLTVASGPGSAPCPKCSTILFCGATCAEYSRHVAACSGPDIAKKAAVFTRSLTEQHILSSIGYDARIVAGLLAGPTQNERDDDVDSVTSDDLEGQEPIVSALGMTANAMPVRALAPDVRLLRGDLIYHEPTLLEHSGFLYELFGSREGLSDKSSWKKRFFVISAISPGIMYFYSNEKEHQSGKPAVDRIILRGGEVRKDYPPGNLFKLGPESAKERDSYVYMTVVEGPPTGVRDDGVAVEAAVDDKKGPGTPKGKNEELGTSASLNTSKVDQLKLRVSPLILAMESREVGVALAVRDQWVRACRTHVGRA